MHILSRLGATTVDLSPISEEVLCKSYTLSPVPPNSTPRRSSPRIGCGPTTSAIESANPAYSAALAGVRSRGGCVPSKDFDTVAGSPVKQKGQISGSAVLERLCSVALLSRTEIDGIGECVLL